MQITEEMVQRQMEDMGKAVDSYKQGFGTAMAWVVQTLKQEEPAVKETPVAGPEAAR